MVLPQNHCFKPCLVFLRNAHVYSALECNHYKTLGLSPSATKAEIKAAYYELSKKHHPDRNKGSEESARIFKTVKTAYEVLGNEQKRMQYDKERILKVVRRPVIVYPSDDNPDYKDEAEKIHFQSKARPPFRKYSYGKTAYYDFDTWYKSHYGKNSAHSFEFQEPRQFNFEANNEMSKEEVQFLTKVKYILFCCFYASIFFMVIAIGNVKKKR